MYKIVNVKEDGNCFYRAIYISATSMGLLHDMLLCLFKTNDIINEDQFVRDVRQLLHDRIINKQDNDVIHKTFDEFDSETYEQQRKGFPSWFNGTFPSKPSNEDKFRKDFAQGVKEMNNWAFELDIKIFKFILENCSNKNLIITTFNSQPDKKQFKFKDGHIYVLNYGEYHYQSIIPVKRVIKRNNGTKSPPSSSIFKECPPGKVLNKKTNRCINDPSTSQDPVKQVKDRSSKSLSTSSKECPPGKILNKKTNRCINDPSISKEPVKRVIKRKPINENSPKSLDPSISKEPVKRVIKRKPINENSPKSPTTSSKDPPVKRSVSRKPKDPQSSSNSKGVVTPKGSPLSPSLNSEIKEIIQAIEESATPSFGIDKSPKTWIMPNRVKYTTWLDKTFKYAADPVKVRGCNTKIDSVNLFPHQRFIKDYMQFDSPYRGLLLYHGLGVGKSCASIAAAEILMNKMDVVVILPASLRSNYINEVKKCGRRFYGLKQHWEKIPLKSFKNHIKTISQASKIDIKLLGEKGNNGLWIPRNNDGASPNFSTLSIDEQSEVQRQIDNIISNRYEFINYNAPNAAEKLMQMQQNGNSFSNKCIVIDEIHNLVSGITGKGKTGKAFYNTLMNAKNCKLILLSGTPVINYPYEISFLINLLVGPKKEFNLFLNNRTDSEHVKNAVEQVSSIDTFIYDENQMSLKFTILPSGFEFINRNTLEIVRSMNKEKTDEHVISELKQSLFKHNIFYKARVTEKVFKALPEDEKEFNRYFVDSNNNTIANPRLFAKRVLGTVSYYSTYSRELYPEWEKEESNEEMTDHQMSVYQKSRALERKYEKRGKISDDGGQVYRFYSRANCNFVFPDDIERPLPSMTQILDETDFDKKGEYDNAITTALNKLVNHPANYLHIDNIGTYSPKFKRVIQRLQDPKLNGTAMIYSQFRRVEGLGILSIAMKVNGFAELKLKKTDNDWDLDISQDDMKKPKFIVFTGNNEETQILLNIFNSDFVNVPSTIRKKLEDMSLDGENTNLRGSLIKVLMITQSGAEGISLKNVRQVHIIEPYWHYVRMNQVIGRAVRTCSHINLPEDERNIKVYIYNMVFTKEQLENSYSLRKSDKSLTTDQHIYEIAKKKETIIEKMLDIMKRASVDCALNAKTHNNLRCFAFPVNLDDSTPTYQLDISQETMDVDYETWLESNEWKGEVMFTKKGNFLIRPETNEVYDYDLYIESGKLVKIGTLRIVADKKQIVTF